MDAISTSAAIRSTYLRYLQTLLPIRDAAIRAALEAALDSDDALLRGPILEATPPFAAGATLHQLISDGTVPPALSRLGTPGGIPLQRPLYVHQEAAVRRARAGRSLVVATGTGSGKTESFMLPVLSGLMDEADAGTLSTPGVRALLLYPMNALANDQMKRLRTLLADMPEVTYGRYIGETEHTDAKAEAAFAQQFPGQTPPSNELLSREAMQATPPHILITNYAMLEYLLLRPADTALFDSNPHSWRTVVLDEAHVYDGASGIEVAMLLRRLADRVATDRTLQYLLTSATVGGQDAGPDVATFATNLTGAPFEYGPDEATRDVIWATRRPVEVTGEWGPLAPGAYAELAATDDLTQALASMVPADQVSADPATMLASEARIADLRRTLAAGPMAVEDLATLMFDGADAVARLGELVQLGSQVAFDDGTPLLSARYHLWARATEGAFVCLSASGPHVWLTRHETCRTCDSTCAEVGVCKRCNAIYLTGSVIRDGKDIRLVPRLSRDDSPEWFILTDAAQVSGLFDEDDETLEQLEGALGDLEGRWWCTRCGRLHQHEPAMCACGGDHFRHVLQTPRPGRRITSCALCGGRSTAGQVRLFESGRDAAVAVLATELYQRLPVDMAVQHPGEGRKLLLFADSRQDAAYFAPYMETSYQQLIWRRCLLAGMLDAGELGWPVSMDEVARGAAKMANQHGFFAWDTTNSEKLRQAGTWLQAELIPIVSATSLEGLGLVAVELARNPAWTLPAPIGALGLDEEEGWALVFELLRTLRDQGAMSTPDGIDPDDDVFEPRKGVISVRGEGPNPKRRIISWVPGRGVNRRLGYLRKVLTATGADPAKAEETLIGLWRWLTSGQTNLLTDRQDQIEGVVQQLNHSLIRLRPVTHDAPVFRCSTCRKVTPYAVRGVCATSGCDGRVDPWAPPTGEGDDNHYRNLARALTPIPLSVREHTAQWAPKEAAAIQQAFVDGKVNALSCSTTFELGVDVGELQAVFLRNVPPRTANYLQRAGRAGRRAASAALVLTYAQQRSHDLTYFKDPRTMISGAVQPPRVIVSNPRIAERHAYSVVLSAFLRHDVDDAGHDTPRNVGDFFITEDPDTPAARLSAFLHTMPAEVDAAVRRVVPQALHADLGLHDGAWISRMNDLLTATGDRIRLDIQEYSQLELEAVENARYGVAKLYQRVATTVKRRSLLNALGSHNLLPKYGFPVDSVELQTAHIPVKEAGKLSLDRDLGLAISDYAPGAEIVAGGWLWKSAGVVRMPGRDLDERYFASCRCGWYREQIGSFAVPSCEGCGVAGKQAPTVRKYVVPEFGFMAEKTSKPKRPTKRPTRIYAGEVFVADGHGAHDPNVLELPGGRAEIVTGERQRMVIVNKGPGNAGFRICDWCGAGLNGIGRFPKSHTNPRTDNERTGPLQVTSLAHRFETDVLTLRFVGPVAHVSNTVWWSTLYAVLEAASTLLEISRDDLDGTLQVGDGAPRLVLFDNVPGGAGHVSAVAERLGDVLSAAHRRVADCDCGRETSCYRCLRGFRNQWRHDELRRGPVADLFERLLGPTTGRPDPRWATAAGESLSQLDGRMVRATHRGVQVEGTLWIEADGDRILTVIVDGKEGVLEGPPDAFTVLEVTA